MCRRITLIPDESGGTCTQSGKKCNVVVKYTYFQKGLDFQGYDSWWDPHIAYIISDKGRRSLKPGLGKDCWRNVGYIFDKSMGSPLVVQQYFNVREDKISIPIVCYGLVTNKAQYEAWQRDEISLDADIIENADKMPALKLCIQRTELVAKELKRQLKNVDKKNLQAETIEQAIAVYFAKCRECFFSNLCPKLSNTDINVYGEGDKILDSWFGYIKATAFQEFDECADRLGLNAKYLLNRAAASKFLAIQLNKIYEGRNSK